MKKERKNVGRNKVGFMLLFAGLAVFMMAGSALASPFFIAGTGSDSIMSFNAIDASGRESLAI